MRKKQKEDEEEERERRKIQKVKDRMEVLERKKDWKEVIEGVKVTGGERYMEEEREE